MAEVKTVKLTRNCNAVQIPAGNELTLDEGTTVDITQTLGGSITVSAMGGLFRINGSDADALGLQEPGADEAPAGEFSEDAVWEALKTCFDPEIPVNIVDLGLIYDLKIEAQESGGHIIDVKMTLTAPGCGMGPVIAGDAQEKITRLAGVKQAGVEVVWDPPWHQSMISEAGRKILGIE
ncbi:MAG: putative Fe-S cluster assembly protein SufT [Verrucomicrobiales bacterium]|nr:putative Fe-S cluster assembly protein SufT [Verrucomicrobiales bacterium]|tara:strand:+ start:5749 stop:6285 length:537 start_codon:yes stop_codon:yes gene_type:complete